MICIQCMQEREVHERVVVHISKDLVEKNTKDYEGDFCICNLCFGKEFEFPSLKSIN